MWQILYISSNPPQKIINLHTRYSKASWKHNEAKTNILFFFCAVFFSSKYCINLFDHINHKNHTSHSMKWHSQLWFMILNFVEFSQLILPCLYSSWYLSVIMSKIYLYSSVCCDHICLKALQAILKSSIYKPAVWHTRLTAIWTCSLMC